MSQLNYDGDGSRQRIAIRNFAGKLRNLAGSLESVATANMLGVIDWEQLRDDIDIHFDYLFEILCVAGEDTEELDVMEGEDIDTSLHPLDPENEYEEFWTDDV